MRVESYPANEQAVTLPSSCKTATWPDALPRGLQRPSQPSCVDKVYAVIDFKQTSIFASAPQPMGHLNRDRAYSSLRRMVAFTWVAGQVPRPLTSEEQALGAVAAGSVRIETTDVVLNCPIVHRGAQGGLPGVLLPASAASVRRCADAQASDQGSNLR